MQLMVVAFIVPIGGIDGRVPDNLISSVGNPAY